MGAWDQLTQLNPDDEPPDCHGEAEEYDVSSPKCAYCPWQQTCWADICTEQVRSHEAFQSAARGMSTAAPPTPGVTMSRLWPPIGAPTTSPVAAAPTAPRVPYPGVNLTPLGAVQAALPTYSGPIVRQVPQVPQTVQGVLERIDGRVVLRLDTSPTPCLGEAAGEMLSTALSTVAGDAARALSPHAGQGNLLASLLRGALFAGAQYLEHRRIRFGRPQRFDYVTRQWVDV